MAHQKTLDWMEDLLRKHQQQIRENFTVFFDNLEKKFKIQAKEHEDLIQLQEENDKIELKKFNIFTRFEPENLKHLAICTKWLMWLE